MMKQLMTQRLDDAMAYAQQAHEGQTRTTNDGEPYYNHVHRVMATVTQVVSADPRWPALRSFPLLLAALLHDVVEDTDVTLADVAERFGDKVAGLVEELTTDHMKHPDIVEHLAKVSDEAKLVKLADILDNLSDLHEHPDQKWAARYLRKKAQVVEAIFSTNPDVPAPLSIAVLNMLTTQSMRLFGSAK